MRKRMILLAGVLTVMMCGCGKSGKADIASSSYADEFVRYEDYDARGDDFLGCSGASVDTENGFYFIVGSYLFVFDYESGSVSPLCTKPNCLHYEETVEELVPECDAFVQGSEFLGYYDGYLYTIAPNRETGERYYVRMNPDGTDRKELYPFDSATDLVIRMHRGVIYRSYSTYQYDGKHSYSLDAMSIVNGQKKFTTIYEGDLEKGQIDTISVYRNDLLLVEHNEGTTKLVLYDIATKEVADVGSDTFLGFTEEGIFLKSSDSYSVFTFDSKEKKPADELYNAYQESHANLQCLLSPYDESMSLLVAIDQETFDFMTVVVGAEGEELYVTAEDMTVNLGHGPFLMNDREYLVFAEKCESGGFILNAYCRDDLIQGKSEPIELLRVQDINDMNHAAIFHKD